MSMMGGPSHWGAMELWTFWAAILGMVGFMQNLLPKEYANIFHTWVRKSVNYFIPYVLFDIPEFYGAGGNEIYDHVQSYLSSTSAASAQHVSLCRPKNATQNIFALAHNETIEEAFLGAKLWWTHEVTARQSGGGGGLSWRGMVSNDEKRKYTLKIRKADKARMLESYVQHVMDVAKGVRESSRDRLLYTNLRDRHSYSARGWESVPFKHPSTFDTLAMDPDLKEEVKEDLLEFTKGKEYYQKAGKAWKRGYLLYGPPGTGKSSMIAAIANFLNYDVYDVELTEVSCNSALRKLLINTTNRSVIVIEDIDCSVDLAERAKAKKAAAAGTEDPYDPDSSGAGSRGRVTLSGLLNFTDGLWSCCGSERIIIFTTNYIEKLDKALLRAGRMDKHIHMSWCRYPAFLTLAQNNLNLETHELFPAIENAIADKAISPADVSELLLKKKRNPTAALKGLLEALKKAPTADPDTTKEMLAEDVVFGVDNDDDVDDDEDVEDERPCETNLQGQDFPQDQTSSDDSSRPESPHADGDNSPPKRNVDNVGAGDPAIVLADSSASNSPPSDAIAA